MTQILGTNKNSKCMFCGQETYGKGCPYSSHRFHVHADDSRRCIYCGATGFGNGCPYNPFGRNHVHGVEYNMMIKESLHRSFASSIFLYRLTESLIETPAYKLGLIDEKGNRQRIPVTLEEKQALTPLDVYIFRLRKLVGENNIEMLNSSVIISLLSESNSTEKFDAVKYEKELKLQEQVKNIVADYKSVMLEAMESNISLNKIESMLIESITTNE
jgi:hypothetical protein